MECRQLGVFGCKRMEPGAASQVRRLGTGRWAGRTMDFLQGRAQGMLLDWALVDHVEEHYFDLQLGMWGKCPDRKSDLFDVHGIRKILPNTGLKAEGDHSTFWISANTSSSLGVWVGPPKTLGTDLYRLTKGRPKACYFPIPGYLVSHVLSHFSNRIHFKPPKSMCCMLFNGVGKTVAVKEECLSGSPCAGHWHPWTGSHCRRAAHILAAVVAAILWLINTHDQTIFITIKGIGLSLPST